MTNAPVELRRLPSEEPISFLQVLTSMVRRWKLFLALPLLFGLAAAGVSTVLPPVYTAHTTFMSEQASTPSLPGGLAALAGQFGLTSLLPSSNLSPDFLVEVLKSRELLEETLRTEFPDPSDPGLVRPLTELMRVPGDTERERLSNGVRMLARKAPGTVERRTGIVTLSVSQEHPELAARVANRMVQLLNEFNLKRRQTTSREQRRFTGERLAEAERELREAEQAQLRFLQANRQYVGSPVLEAEAARLDRLLQIKQEAYLTLVRAHEEARIAEVRDTPVITVVDSAVPPVQRARPKPTLNVLLAVLLGCIVATAVALIAELRDSAGRAARPDYQEFTEAVARARRQIRSALR